LKLQDRSWVRLLAFFAVTTLGSSLVIAAMLAGVTVAFGSGESVQSADDQLLDPMIPGQAFSGVITDARCGLRHMSSQDGSTCVRMCIRNGSKYVLATRERSYELAGNVGQFAQLAGKPVSLVGVLDSDLIKVSSASLRTAGREDR